MISEKLYMQTYKYSVISALFIDIYTGGIYNYICESYSSVR